MRNLSSVNNEFVLCRGWIDEWKDVDDENVRYIIKNPIFKRPKKNILFDDLPVISQEDHINLFLPKDTVNEMLVYTRRDAPLERYEKIHFSGIVKDYKRKNGSSDYGIHPTKFFNIHWDLEELNKEVNEYLDNVSNDSKRFTTPETLYFLEYKIKLKLHIYRKKLEESGNQLPTFIHTFRDYVTVLETHLDGCQKHIDCIRWSVSSRENRRTYKVKKNFSKDIPPLEEKCPNLIFNPELIIN